MVSRARALPRFLLRRGAAGDAGSARGGQIASNIAIQLGTRAITMMISIVTVSLTARTLAPTGFGVWNGTSNYVGLFLVLTDLGLTIAATQRMASEPEREPEWLGALVGARTMLSFIAATLCAGSIPLLLNNTHDSRVVALITTTTILAAGPSALMTVFQTRLRAELALLFSVLQGALWLAAVGALAMAHASVVAFAIANAVIVVVVTGLQVHATRRLVRIAWRRGLRLLRSLAHVATPLGIGGVMNTIYYQVDSVLLLQIAGPKEAGIYGAAYGFLGPLALLPTVIMSAFFPVLSATYQREPERARKLVQICADFMGMTALPVLAGSVALSGQIIHLLYGAEFQQSAGLLPILMIAFVSIGFGTLAGFLAPVLGMQWRFAAYATAGAVANVILNLALIPRYGAYGSAWATVVTEVLTMVLLLSAVLRALRLRLSARRLMRTLLLAAVMAGAMIFARPLGLLPTATLGVMLYAVGLFALRIVDREELLALQRRRRELAGSDRVESPPDA